MGGTTDLFSSTGSFFDTAESVAKIASAGVGIASTVVGLTASETTPELPSAPTVEAPTAEAVAEESRKQKQKLLQRQGHQATLTASPFGSGVSAYGSNSPTGF